MVVLFREGTYEILNCGIYLSLVIGVLLILRPVTNRCSPRDSGCSCGGWCGWRGLCPFGWS